MKKVVSFFFILVLFIGQAAMAAAERTITIENNCPMEVLWGITGTPIKTNGIVATCNKGNTLGAVCDQWQGAGTNDKGVCGGDNKCYFEYPILKGNTTNPSNYYVLPSQASKQYTVKLVNLVSSGKNIAQYTMNISPQFDCVFDNGVWTCKSGACDGRNASKLQGQCPPDKGVANGTTQAELTFNDVSNDFYDLSIINGMNLPVEIEPASTPGSQPAKQSNFWCTKPGAAPTGDKTKLNGCSWLFSPPALPAAVYLIIDRDIHAANPERCNIDSDCSQPGQRCGLKYPEDLKSYKTSDPQKAYCGTPLGYNTTTNICSLGGVSTDLEAALGCSSEQNITLTDPSNPSNTRMVSNNDFYGCTTSGTRSFLDSCYNFANKKGDPWNYTSSTLCCGCIDWPGVPTESDLHCTGQPEPTKATTCKDKDTDCQVYPNATWLSLVKPKLEWLIDGCPDAYEYQFGDKHGTIQCSTKDDATTSGNAMNYKVTFCPAGKTLFPGNSTASISISNVQSTVISNSHATISWTVSPQPTTGAYSSTVQLQGVSGSSYTCTTEHCTHSYTNLTASTSYVAQIDASITAGSTTSTALPAYTSFTTNSSPTTQTVTIESAVARASSDASIDATWDVSSNPPAQVASTAAISIPGQSVSSTKSCSATHCHVLFEGLLPSTVYQIALNASGGGASAAQVLLFPKTEATTAKESIHPPTKGEMKLSHVLEPGAYCRPTTYRFPLLDRCQLGATSDYRCVPKMHNNELVGEWYLDNLPACLPESAYIFSSLTDLTAVYGTNVSFTFKPAPGWGCTSKGSHLECFRT